MPPTTAEHARIREATERTVPWRKWGPYLSERAWGTVREDYSRDGSAWEFVPHDHARSKAMRWNEDGLAGLCDRGQNLCLSLALWNEKDPILKERAFGLTGNEGNHGEDVKEVYHYLDATPTSSYLRWLYKYPQRAYPYAELVAESRRRGPNEREYEVIDSSAFVDDRYFDVEVEYAKAGAEDVFMVVTVHNRGPERARLHVLPQAWFRKTWGWNPQASGSVPELRQVEGAPSFEHVALSHEALGRMHLYVETGAELLFTDNETNAERLYGVASASRHVKDAFHEAIVGGRREATNPDRRGTKVGAWHVLDVPAGASARVRMRLAERELDRPFSECDEVVERRRREADEFYLAVQGPDMPEEHRRIHRQAIAGLLWTFQFYAYDVARWLDGDDPHLPPPAERQTGRNAHWRHVQIEDVISMPDAWEYPWFAAWDLAFHCVALAHVDPDLAKAQLKLLVKEWYQHPNGQIPAYEWAFSDLNPPVHAWATYQVFKTERKLKGAGDRLFLERVFHKLLINFAWWVNRVDAEGNSIFEGGFLGLDNITLFDRSEKLPGGATLEQADATGWMAMYCLDLMRIALELAPENSAYEDLASKFFEHFLYIARAMHVPEPGGVAPWSEEEGFYFDILRLPDGRAGHLRVFSTVGLIPLFAVAVLEPQVFERLPNFARRFEWFLDRHPELRTWVETSPDGRRTLALCNKQKLPRVLSHLLREDGLLSPFGPRSLSKEHEREPCRFWLDGRPFQVDYEPGEASSRLKGGNSNWRGPVWMPTSYLLYRSLLRFDHCYGDSVKVPFPCPDGPRRTLREIARELAGRMVRLYERDAEGRIPAFGASRPRQQLDPRFREHLLFFEYFHGDTGEGLGAEHQTGWTALVADLAARLARGKG